MLEEEELAPTYEVYFTGCSLRCRFCSMDQAIQAPNVGEWVPPAALAEDILGGDHPPFRSIAFVGGDPTVNLPYLRALVPELRARDATVPLVLNTHLYLNPARVPEVSEWIDTVVGDLHFWTSDCARSVAATPDYPEVARACAEAFLDQGSALILRVLVLPGHLDCCARPSIDWVARLSRRFPEQVRLHVMTHYAPLGRARGHAVLGRMLTDEERERVRSWVPEDVGSLARAQPPSGACSGRDPDVPIEIDTQGRVHFPLVTGAVLPLVQSLDSAHGPSRRER